MKKKVLIATINDYVVYQPTILNLYDSLASKFDVEIISFEPTALGKEKDLHRNIRYLTVNPTLKNFINKVDFVMSKVVTIGKRLFSSLNYRYLYYNRLLPATLAKALRNSTADIVIAVDIPALAIAQKIFGKAHFLSLEIDKDDIFFKKIDRSKIQSVFIQNQIRFDFLFGGATMPRFFVQNAPNYNPLDLNKTSSFRHNLVWAGTILERFGIFNCLEFIHHYPEYVLVLKGGADRATMNKLTARYINLLETQRVIINQEYLDTQDFIKFLSAFRIGFCFYSWELINSNFNYATAPSGKLFMYMAAGVPVVACNIPGFDFVKKFGAGVLIDNYSPETIKAAIEEIDLNYEQYSTACLKVAEYFSFGTSVEPYINFLKRTADN
ncbi:MAG: hypothetical protein H7Y31_08935 [Chitinophagaceae bacterium]|nr:hypothetical protein [Chitinophagaceae bacterium]